MPWGPHWEVLGQPAERELREKGTRALFAVSVGRNGCSRVSRFGLDSLNNFSSLRGEGLPLVVWALVLEGLGLGSTVQAL